MKIQILAAISATLLLVSCNQKNNDATNTDENMNMMGSDTAVVVNDSMMMDNDSTMMHNDSTMMDGNND